MSRSCTRFHEYLLAEIRMIRGGIAANQRRMEKKQGAVTYEKAKQDYQSRLLPGNAKRFRQKFCSKCPDRSKCEQI